MASRNKLKDDLWNFVSKKGKVREKEMIQEFVKSDKNPHGITSTMTFHKYKKLLLSEGKLQVSPEYIDGRLVSIYYVPDVWRWELTTQKSLYNLGDLRLDFIRWFGTGEPLDEFTVNDVTCQYEETPIPMPEELQTSKEKTVKEKIKEAREKGQVFDNNPHYKLLKIHLEREFLEEIKDRKQRVCLAFGPTDFFTCAATNLSLDKHLREDDERDPVTIRERYVKTHSLEDPTYLQSSPLANSFGIALATITQDDKILLQRRSQQVWLGPSKLTVATAEMMLRDRDIDRNGRPSPFTTAQRCVKAELGIDIKPENTIFLLFGVRLDYALPQALGILRLRLKSNELPTLYKAIDRWEGLNFPEEFSLDALKKYLLSARASLISDTAKLTIVLALVNQYGFEKVEKYLKA